jgi:hypothetical protein
MANEGTSSNGFYKNNYENNSQNSNFYKSSNNSKNDLPHSSQCF